MIEMIVYQNNHHQRVGVLLKNRELIDWVVEGYDRLNAVYCGRVERMNHHEDFLIDFQTFKGYLPADPKNKNRILQAMEKQELLAFKILRSAEGLKNSKVKWLSDLQGEILGQEMMASPFFIERVSQWCQLKVEKIYTDHLDRLSRMDAFFSPTLVEVNSFSKPLFQRFEIEKKIMALFSKNIYTHHGAIINVENCRALTVVDVNSGSCRLTPFEINEEAFEVLLSVLLVCRIGGVVVVDFLNLSSTEEKIWLKKLKENTLLSCFSVMCYGFTKAHLFELSLPRFGKRFEEALSLVALLKE